MGIKLKGAGNSPFYFIYHMANCTKQNIISYVIFNHIFT
nr:MAG TPA: hypothetical protein [Caudoviricetes sp.]